MRRLWLLGLVACRSASAPLCDDAPVLVTAQGDHIQVMRADGDVIERYVCGCDALLLFEVAISPDARWIVASGSEYVSPQVGNVARACIIDRATKQHRLVHGSRVTGFDHRSQRIGGVLGMFARSDSDEVLDLQTGELREDRSTKDGWLLPGDRILQSVRDGEGWRPTIFDRATGTQLRAFPTTEVVSASEDRTPAMWGMAASEDGSRVAIPMGRGVEIFDASTGVRVGAIRDAEGANEFAISNDGRRLVGWIIASVLFGERRHAAPPPPRFSVAMWDVTTGQRVWRQLREEISGNFWKFSPDGTRVIAVDSTLSLQADTGELLPPAAVPWEAMTQGHSCSQGAWSRGLAQFACATLMSGAECATSTDTH